MLIGLAAIAIILLFLVSMYNSLISKRNQVENAFGSIDAQLKQRYDLIPNLVAAVQQYMQHERGTLNEITRLRTEALDAGKPTDERVKIDNQISKALGGILVAVENYPDLKASQNFQQLQRALNEVEAQIAAARRTYNAVVTSYNTAIETVPGNVFASMFKMPRKSVFEIPPAERANVSVKQMFDSKPAS